MFTLREERMSNELLKIHLHGLPFDAVIHQFTGRDMGQPHCHPFSFDSKILYGAYLEKVYKVDKEGGWSVSYNFRQKGDSFFIEAETIHELIDLPYGDCYTLIQPREKVREPCFYDFSGKIAKKRVWNESGWKEFKNI